MTVVGLGSMGSALAEAFVDAGHAVTVWNRTPSKAAPLVAKGAVHARSTDEAVAASGLVITCLTTYDDTLAALGPAAAALDGRALVTLNSGSPRRGPRDGGLGGRAGSPLPGRSDQECAVRGGGREHAPLLQRGSLGLRRIHPDPPGDGRRHRLPRRGP
ncbi:3-hydroxyisobutyrate dehydrogenase family protein [Streptomyces globisporus]|uniref:3-hydroxyisobutyrate dehydrogenase family protein n=1 Tax=Streptomyces globisporus TaxID=1908 RepID=A0ABM9GS77_STRGL|nr:3-hydroxyisobutyrate dehydrogenase family protein [Streptomyces globisporus]